MSGVRLDLHASDLKLAPGILRQSMRALEHAHNIPFGYSILKDIADQIEAQTKPQRIPEPGPWGVVEALIGGEVFTFVNRGSGWVCVDDGALWEWDRLDSPTLIREGLS